MMETRELIAAVETLTVAVDELTRRVDVYQGIVDRIDTQSQSLDKQGRGLHAVRIAVAFTVLGLVLVLVALAGVGVLYQKVQAVQTRTSAEVLCPLYTVFSLSIKTNPTPPNLTPEQIAVRQQAGETITAGLTKLGCT